MMKNKSMIDGIQILRGLAALLVIIRHGTKEIDTFNFEVGQFGVDLFFVISGFVIYLTSQNISFKLFALKRIIRIVPSYWLVTTITLIAAILINKSDVLVLIQDFIFSILFIPHGDLFPTLYVGWTLNFEMWFYIIFGTLIFFKTNLLNGATITILSTISLGLVLLSLQDWVVTAPTVPLLPITIEFLAGVWIAHYYQQGFKLAIITPCLLLTAAIIWLLIFPTASAYTVWRPLVWALPAVAIVVAFLGLERHIKFRNLNTLMLLGNASYATYLVHPLVIRFVMIITEKLHLSLNNWLLLCCLVVISLFFGTVFHLTVEKHLQRFISLKFLDLRNVSISNR